jgi:eukaryotic-like serine/threonine-protein kinase
MRPADMDDLLFGVVALRHDRIPSDRLAAAARDWRISELDSLPDFLLARGELDDSARAEIERDVRDLLVRFDGDAAAALTFSLSEALRGATSRSGPGMPLAEGIVERAARYEPGDLHASGGMGSVWLTRDTRLGREIALKEIRADVAPDDAVRARFLREARITGRLQHPGIVPVYDLHEDAPDASPFYTMRLVRGRTLDDAVREYHERRRAGEGGALMLRELLNAFLSVVNTMAFAHANRVVHRDLKGSNVVLGDFGEVIVLDWGLAKELDAAGDDVSPGRAEPAATPGDSTGAAAHVASAVGSMEAGVTVDGQFLGTPGYMAPEQAAGRTQDLDERTDIYSLGVILYEILTGELPFQGDNVMQVLGKIIDQPPRPPRSIVRDVPRALDAICLKATEKEREARYATATALADDLRRFLADEPVSAYAEPLAQRAGRWARRNKPLVAGGLALLVTAVIALSIGTFLMGQKQAEILAQHERAEANFALARDAVDQYFTRVSENPELRSHGFEDLRRQLLATGRDFYLRFVEEQADAPELRADLGSALIRLGNMERILGEREAAEASYGRAIGVFDGLSSARSGGQTHRTDRAVASAALALLQSETGQPDAAEQSFRFAIAEYDSVLSRGVGDTARVRGMLKAQALENYGTFLLERGRIDESEEAYIRSVALREAWHAAQPDGAEQRKQLVYARVNLGTLYARTGRVQQGMEQFRSAVPIADALAEQHPGDPEYLNMVATVYGNLGGTYLLLERFDEARAVYRRHAELRELLAERHPMVLNYRVGLGSAYNNLGALHARRGEPALALPWFDRSAAVFEEVLAREPGHVVGRRSSSHVSAWRARVLEALGRYPESHQAWLRAIEYDDHDQAELLEGRDRTARLR